MVVLKDVTLIQVGTDARANRAQIEAQSRLLCRRSIQLPAMSSYKEYNRFIIQDLHTHFTTSHCLLIQWDGFPVNLSAWTDDFLKYDYIGAVMWNGYVGNGGFSLRSKAFCEVSAGLDMRVRNAAIRERIGINPKDYDNEDLFLCIERREDMERMGIKFAPIDIADRFSWERSPLRPFYPGSFGIHSPASMEALHL
jgi:hypothetical protein